MNRWLMTCEIAMTRPHAKVIESRTLTTD